MYQQNAKSFITINLESPHEIQHIGLFKKKLQIMGDINVGDEVMTKLLCRPNYSRVQHQSPSPSPNKKLHEKFLNIIKAIQGMPLNCHHALKKLTQRWVTAFYVAYSNDNTKWKLFKSRIERSYMTTFEGNTSIK